MTQISLKKLESYSTPTGLQAENALLDSQEYPAKKYQTALIIGRFQPLHRGHIYLLHCALRYASSLIICIGSSNVQNLDNPFTVQTREDLLKRAIAREGLLPKVHQIFSLPDSPDDSVWLATAIQKAGVFDLVIGNNEWVNQLFGDAGYNVQKIPLFERSTYEGKIIREKLRKEGALR